MIESEVRQLSQDDILRLGRETGMRVQAAGDTLSSDDQEQMVDELAMRAVELTYRPQVLPEDVDD